MPRIRDELDARGLAESRYWRWCVLRTIRDVRLSAARRRALSLPNARRLFERRWHGCAEPTAVGRELGVAFIQNYHDGRLRRATAGK